MPKATFTILEKSYLIRKGITAVIEKIPDTQLIQQIENDEELSALNHNESDFLIINQSFIDSDRYEKIKELEKKYALILLQTNESDQFIRQINWAEQININDSQKDILKKLNTLIGHKSQKNSLKEIPEEISNREADILKNIALGYSNKEIADKLFISTHTVVTHRKNITRKLGIKTVPGLTIYAILNKLIDINDTELPIS